MEFVHTREMLQISPERIVLTRIRGEVERQLQSGGAPEEIRGFLIQHWSRLMTDIFLAKGNQDPDWQAGWDTMNALLWSLCPKHGHKETTHMLRALPSILDRLQEGCEALGVPVAERNALFERLAMLHAAIVREGLQNDQAGVTNAGWQIDGDALEGTGADLSKFGPAARGDVVSFGQMDDVGKTALPELKAGTRISLRVGAEDRLMLVNWVSPLRGMYLFTNERGLDAMTLTRARLEAKFRDGEAKLLG